MAKLTGVKALSDCEIEYGGERYVLTEGPAQLGDIVRCGIELLGISKGVYYLIEVARDGVVGFSNDVGDFEGLNGRLDHDVSNWVPWFAVFRRAENAPQSPAEIRALIEQKRAELADLEALIAPSVGDFVRVTKSSYNDMIAAGEIARVDKKYRSRIPYHIKSVIGDVEDWIVADAVEKITPAEAKAALIAQIEEMFQSE